MVFAPSVSRKLFRSWSSTIRSAISSFDLNQERRCCERPHVDDLIRRRTDPVEGQFTRVTAPEALQERIDLWRKLVVKSDNTEIPNVMFKWDTKLGACNMEPNRDTPVQKPHSRTHKHTYHCDNCPVSVKVPKLKQARVQIYSNHDSLKVCARFDI